MEPSEGSRVNSCVISGCRVTQERASVSELETACQRAPHARLRDLTWADQVSEAFVLQTCLRAELYVVTETAAAGHSVLSSVGLDVPDDLVVEMDHEESLRHLFRVTAGLESFVVGEDQILGQIQDAIETADTVGSIGPVLETALSKAIHIGQQVREETPINDGPTSIGGAAVSLVERERTLDQGSVLVIGTGEMGTHIAQAIDIRGNTELLLANRTRESAERLAAQLDTVGSVVDFEAIPVVLGDADVVITATAGPDPILNADAFSNSGHTFVVDLAQPRDVAPDVDDCEDVILHDLDTLETITERARKRRRDADGRVETMIDEAITDLLDQYKRQRVDGVVAGMYRGAERIKRRELETAFSKLEHHGGLTDEQREDVEALADALVSELLAPPTAGLRDAAARDDWRTIATAIDLFDPDIEQPMDAMPDPTEPHALMHLREAASVTDSRDDD